MKTVTAHGMTPAALALPPGAAGHDRTRQPCRCPKVACRTSIGDPGDASGLRCT